MDFRMSSQQIVDKENHGVLANVENKEPQRVVSILKSSQRINCPLEKKLTKVSFKNSPVHHTIVPYSTDLPHVWQEIRKLDEEENWTERTQILTKEDHKLYLEVAKEWLEELIADLPCYRQKVTDMATALDDLPEIVHPEIPSIGDVNAEGADNMDLDTELMADFSKLQIDPSDCPRTFSPIGSERTSPEQDNLTDSNEDIDKLLVHDEATENAVLTDDVLHTGNERTDNLLKEITREEHPYKSAELFKVNPADLQNEFQDHRTLEDLSSSEKTAEVEDMFKQDAENQKEEDDQFGDDAFKPASEAMWELDYLEQCGTNNTNFKESALARQSLYVKFDPLIKGASPQSPMKNKVGVRDVLPPKPPSMGDNLLLMDSPAPNLKSSGPVSRRTYTDPSTAQNAESPCGVDKLLNFSPSKLSEVMRTEPERREERIVEEPYIVDNRSTPEASNIEVNEEELRREKALFYTKEDFDEAVRRETEAQRKQALFCSKEEFDEAVKKETSALRQQMKEESAIRDMESRELTERNDQLKRETGEMRVVMQEYEKTIADMIEKNQKSQDHYHQSTSEVAKERDQLQADLTAVETAFSDLHRRYEKLKGVVENFKKNEEILKKATTDYQEKLKKSEEKYRLLKKHAEEKIESANIEITRVRKSNESEIAVMKAALKKEQTKTASLEKSLQQKVSENAELTAICDELINKMGGHR
ncbi:Transforming acidic coiled-coil-containing protein 2 [Porites harrisoni]